MQRWEYKVIRKTGDEREGVESELDKLGAAGWELITVDDYGYFYFKRAR